TFSASEKMAGDLLYIIQHTFHGSSSSSTPPIFYLTFIVPMFLGDRATKAAKKVSVVGFDIDVSFCFFLVLSD
ncbi:hypothetical protein ACJX0J_010711, partial [Zea mays]